MTSTYFIQGLLIGFSIAAPVGPIGVLTIKRTLAEGRLSGFTTGLGAALADSIYGAIAGFGLTAISSFLLAQNIWLKLIGGLFLGYLGIKSFLSKPATKEAAIESNGIIQNIVSTFFLTMTNPSTIISFLAVFTGMGFVSEHHDYLAASTLVCGVFIGSAAWWLILSSVVGYFRDKITSVHLIWINRLSGLILLGFGLWALYSLVGY